MERDHQGLVDRHPAYNFNSHAHVERDQILLQLIPAYQISTHTLTWSVTRKLRMDKRLTKDFNSHAHVERDGNSKRNNHNSRYFNSHAHVERD